MSEWVDHETMVLKNYTADEEERGPVYENESLTLLHAGALKTVSCHNGKFKPHLPPSFGCVWWDTLPWYFTSWRLASMLNSQAKFPLLCILCLLLPHRHRWWMSLTPRGCWLCHASEASGVRGQLTHTNGIEGHRLDELIIFPTANEEPGHLVVMI